MQMTSPHFPVWLGIMIPVLVLLAIWDATWKAIAMWKSARHHQLAWFVCIVIFNTAASSRSSTCFGVSATATRGEHPQHPKVAPGLLSLASLASRPLLAWRPQATTLKFGSPVLANLATTPLTFRVPRHSDW